MIGGSQNSASPSGTVDHAMEQATFAELEHDSKKRRTRRELFLEKMGGLVRGVPCSMQGDVAVGKST